MAYSARIVTLLTDFGLRDHYAASMKGIMLGLNPNLTLVDISHTIPPQDISSAAFILGQAYPCFPAGTIHLAIVDPGVGTARKGIIVSAGTQVFVGPDNGIFTWVFEREESFTVYEITADHYFRKPVSSTFHGRDIFAPVAGWISRDIPLQQVGQAFENPVRLKIPALTRVRDALIQATVLAVDGFGNLITNLKPEDLPVYAAPGTHTCKMLVSQREVTDFRMTFGEGVAGEIFVVPGSSGYLEIVMRNGSAAATLNAAAGALVGVVLT
jgi:S-adenosyl-L-methionine hydrolase (adenosine-forming)